jgi:hypothetical protein
MKTCWTNITRIYVFYSWPTNLFILKTLFLNYSVENIRQITIKPTLIWTNRTRKRCLNNLKWESFPMLKFIDVIYNGMINYQFIMKQKMIQIKTLAQKNEICRYQSKLHAINLTYHKFPHQPQLKMIRR